MLKLIVNQIILPLIQKSVLLLFPFLAFHRFLCFDDIDHLSVPFPLDNNPTVIYFGGEKDGEREKIRKLVERRMGEKESGCSSAQK